MSMSVSMPLGGVQVGSYDSYDQAQAAVDYLSDEKFAVENVTIIGSDLRQIEKVTGRLTWGRVLTAGAAGGAWWGLFVGLLLGIFSRSGTAWGGSGLGGPAVGLGSARSSAAWRSAWSSASRSPPWATRPPGDGGTSRARARSWPAATT